MKNLILVSALAVFTSGMAHAEDLNVGGSIASVCEVSNINPDATFPVFAKDQKKIIDFSLKCNDADGAEIKLISSEGHLQNADNEDEGIGYSAKLEAAPYSFTLDASSGINDTSFSQSHPGSETLAAGGVPGKIELTILEEPKYSGNYADTLKLVVTAR